LTSSAHVHTEDPLEQETLAWLSANRQFHQWRVTGVPVQYPKDGDFVRLTSGQLRLPEDAAA
jgi:hypothetical protein